VPPGTSSLRLACYGWVDPDAGSLASANHLVLAELLRRGVAVDFYANREHVPEPPGLAGEGAFRYAGVDPPRLAGAVPPRAQRIANWLLGPGVRHLWRRRYAAAAGPRHEQAPYDAVLSLSTPPAFTLPGVPTVAWLQGPLQTELEAIRRLRRQIVRTSGRAFYAALVAYYRADLVLDRAVLRDCDRVICGSRWAVQALARLGYPVDRVSALPYPVDLDAFRPAPAETTGPPTILSLGRLDPRKRLDLVLDAFSLVLDDVPEAKLRIVGRPGYAPNQLSLLDGHPHRDRITYSAAVPRAEVVPLLQEAAVLLQPSEHENFGSAVAEALACGTPVVVGPTNGTADYVDARSHVFPHYAPADVSAAVVTVLSSVRSAPDEVRASARSAAERSLSPGVVTDGLLEVIDAAVRGGTDRRRVPR
jgi:glycosyltransferase involved in cell wall biosynthesis